MNSRRQSSSSTRHMARWNVPSTWRWIIRVVCCVAAAVLYFVFEKGVYPFRRGFFCNDESIRYPAKSNTINFSACLGIGLSITIPTIIIIRVYNNLMQYGSFLPPLSPLLRDFLTLIFGGFSVQGTLDVTKVIIGRLRPSFLSICFANNVTAVANACASASGGYVTDYECLCSLKEEREARLSFPSGHTSFIMYTMVFTICYLQKKSSDRWIKLLMGTLQLFYLNVALAIAMSRVSDYKHHWSDVLGGIAYGGGGGFLTAYFLLDADSTNEATIPLRKNGHDDAETNYTSVTQSERQSRPMQP